MLVIYTKLFLMTFPSRMDIVAADTFAIPCNKLTIIHATLAKLYYLCCNGYPILLCHYRGSMPRWFWDMGRHDRMTAYHTLMSIKWAFHNHLSGKEEGWADRISLLSLRQEDMAFHVCGHAL